MSYQTQSIFISILSDHLNFRLTETPPNIDEAELAKIAHQQQCEGIVYNQTHIPALQQAAAATAYYSANRRKLLQEIYDAFAENGIPYLLFKGTEIAQYYPIPMLRTMGDSDILVHISDKESADKILKSIGLNNAGFDDAEWHYSKNNLDFELHHRLLYDEAVNLPILKNWTDTVWEHASTEDGIRYTIEPEYHFVYLLIHLRKHLMNRGVGFRQFMDIAVMLKQPLRWDAVNTYLGELGLTAFASKCFAICNKWFNIDIPYAAEISDNFYMTVTEKVFADGIFGFEDDTNKGNVINFELQKSSRIGLLFKSAFLPYSSLRRLRVYSFLDDRPYLLPAAWAYRFLRVIREHRVKSAAKNLFAPLTTQIIDGREEYLKSWGLLNPSMGEK